MKHTCVDRSESSGDPFAATTAYKPAKYWQGARRKMTAERLKSPAMVFSLQEGDLCLRGMLADDAAAVQQCRNLPEVARYQSWRPASIQEVVELSHEQSDRAPGMQKEPFQLVIEITDEDGKQHIAGDMGSGAFEPRNQMEVGIVLNPAWQGRGIALRACRLLFDHLIAAGLHRITARVDPRNEPSIKLFERLRFDREGLERQCWWDKDYNEWTDEILFAILASEWPNRRKY